MAVATDKQNLVPLGLRTGELGEDVAAMARSLPVTALVADIEEYAGGLARRVARFA